MKTPISLSDLAQWIYEDDLKVPDPLYLTVLLHLANQENGCNMAELQTHFPTIPRTTLSTILQFWAHHQYLYKGDDPARGRGRPEVRYILAFDWEDKPDMLLNKEK